MTALYEIPTRLPLVGRAESTALHCNESSPECTVGVGQRASGLSVKQLELRLTTVSWLCRAICVSV